MPPKSAPFPGLNPFLGLVGTRRWLARLAEIRDIAASGPRTGQAIRQRHGIELSLERLRNNPGTKPSAAEHLLGRIAAETARVAANLTSTGHDRLVEQLRTSLSGENTLIPLFHLIRTAMLQRSTLVRISPGR